MLKQFKVISFVAFSLLVISSCKKAGIDGDATLVVFAKHHGTIIPNQALYPDTVYVKFNTQELPADPTHDYDAIFVGEAGEDHVHMASMHTGKYFLFVTGWDTSINARVFGGMAVKIKWKDRKSEIDLDVPVVE